MNKLLLLIFSTIIFLLSSCSTTKNYNPSQKIAASTLQQDYNLMRSILEAKHPSLYWYTPKDKMDSYFDKYYRVIADSMTQQQFGWLAIAPLLDKIHCGHTSMGLGKNYRKWSKGKVLPSFPLYLKIIGDSLVVYGNLNAKTDSILKRGTVITSINGISDELLVKYMMEFLSEDGYAINVSNMRLSGNFPFYHRNIFGLSKSYAITYLDSTGNTLKTTLPLYTPIKDSVKKSIPTLSTTKKVKIKRVDRLKFSRLLEIDSNKKFAILTLNTFSNGHLRSFYRRSFKKLKAEKIENLIIDIRTNGGGRVGMSTLLTKYISKLPFKVADTVFAKARGLGQYRKYFSGGVFNNLQMFLMSSKRADGLYHLKRFEKHTFSPKKNNYSGKVFVVTGGNTFSASTLFCNAIKGQAHVKLIGEETGGGAYGNTGMMIPNVTLPNTGIQIRLPLYRLVQPNNGQIKGTGIIPDILVPPNYDALKNGYDKKIIVIKEMIK